MMITETIITPHGTRCIDTTSNESIYEWARRHKVEVKQLGKNWLCADAGNLHAMEHIKSKGD